MNDPHVEALIYRVEHRENVNYERATPLEHDGEHCRVRIEDCRARFEMKDHYATTAFRAGLQAASTSGPYPYAQFPRSTAYNAVISQSTWYKKSVKPLPRSSFIVAKILPPEESTTHGIQQGLLSSTTRLRSGLDLARQIAAGAPRQGQSQLLQCRNGLPAGSCGALLIEEIEGLNVARDSHHLADTARRGDLVGIKLTKSSTRGKCYAHLTGKSAPRL